MRKKKYIRFIGDGKDMPNNCGPEYLHLESSLGIDYTLCGVSCDDDYNIGSHMILNSGIITCPDCISIIKHCRNVKTCPTRVFTTYRDI
jgi:hypothetical protein